MNLELQTRAVEYTSLFTKHNPIRYFFIERWLILIIKSNVDFVLRGSIVERMPVLISNQTSNTTNNEQQEQIYDQEENSSIDRQTNHVSSNEPVVNNILIYSFIYFFY